MPIRTDLIDELLKDYTSPQDILGEDGLLKQLTKAVVERALGAELTHHLGYEPGDVAAKEGENCRNGHTSKTIVTDHGPIEIEVPRDRDASFEPQLVRKRQRRLAGFDDKIISMYAHGMSVRDIQHHLEQIYGVEVSPELISSVTDAVLDEVRAWQARPLDAVYPILYLDALFVTTREGGRAAKRAVYVALGVRMDGYKEVLGLWIAETEGAKFWLGVLTELKNRGVRDVFVACVDGLTGFADAIEAAFPHTLVQSCVVHQVRNSLAFVSYRDRKAVASALRPIYNAATAEAGYAAIDEFEARWGARYPTIARGWRANWARLSTLFEFPEPIRRAIYTTNAVESLNATLKRVVRNRALFPNDEAVMKLMYLGLRNASRNWTRPIQNWKAALNHFAIMFEDRIPSAAEIAHTQLS